MSFCWLYACCMLFFGILQHYSSRICMCVCWISKNAPCLSIFWLGAVVPAGDVTSKNARSAADGSAGVAARFWPKKASIAVYHHSAYCMLPLLLVCCVCLCRRVWSAVLLCCRVVCCVKGKRRVSTEMGRRYLPRGQGMFCLDDAKRLDRHP